MANERQHLGNVVQGISIENVALGEYLVGDDGAAYRKFPSNQSPSIIPTRQKTVNNMVGSGNPYPQKGKVTTFDPRNIPYSGLLNTTISHRILRNFQGGAIVETTNAVPGTIDSAISMKKPGVKPLFANILRSLGNDSLVHGDVFVQTVEISQSGLTTPTMTATLQNSGHFKKLSDTTIDVADIEAMDEYLVYDANKTTITFYDGTTTFDLVTERRFIDVSFRGSQGVVVENMPGQPFIDTTQECKGSYSDIVYIDMQSGEIVVKFYNDEAFAEFESYIQDKTITSLTLTFKTCEAIGLTTHKAEIEIKFPFSEMIMNGDSQGNFAASTVTFPAQKGDSVTGSLINMRIRQVGSLDETA